MSIFSGITKSVVNIADDIPLIGSLLKHVGNTIAGGVPGISELIRIFADNPARGVNAMIAYVHKQGPITVCPFSIHLIHILPNSNEIRI